MKKWTITIRDNETEKDEVSTQTDCIICSFENEDGADRILFTNCNVRTLLTTAVACAEAIDCARQDVVDDFLNDYTKQIADKNTETTDIFSYNDDKIVKE